MTTYMVNIISGKKDSGKTAKMEKLFRETINAAGFVSIKVYKDGRVIGYNVVNLRGGYPVPLARIRGNEPENWNKKVMHGKFSFSTEGFAAAETIVRRALKENAENIFLDEIGKLELKGKGFAPLLKYLLTEDIHLYIAVRSENVVSVVNQFGINNYRIS